MTEELRVFMLGYDNSDEHERVEMAADLAQALAPHADVHQAEAEPPEGAKGGGALEWSQLVVSGFGTLPLIVQAVQAWLDRRRRTPTEPRAAVTLRLGEDEITLEAASDAERQELVRIFIERHAPS